MEESPDPSGPPKEQPPPETLRQKDYRLRRLWRVTGIPVHRRGKPDFGPVHLSGFGQRGARWPTVSPCTDTERILQMLPNTGSASSPALRELLDRDGFIPRHIGPDEDQVRSEERRVGKE